MTASELRAFLENIVDTTPILFPLNGVLTELTEEHIELVTLQAENFTGPTVLILYTEDDND